ncbi:unnamed protein product [Ceutorhynchus assimilis]|uniref:Uncharacterized protein n=1 Tax=Ceutorhynchus assimilis TaxID=467358 RepID=A0A9N9QMK0_9CUCU|nr:unnamed protein product [Ceutorhynchus assimilis]
MLLSIVIYGILIAFIVKMVLKSGYTFYHGPECLVGKVAIVTGGNKGIGFEVSRCLASRGCKVIIACRSNAENERQNLIQTTKNEQIYVKHLDLKSFESVRNFAKEIYKTESKIDILVNNAGVAADTGLSGDGLDPVVQTNLFGPFLLTHLLADLLKKSNDARIVFTSSIMAFINDLTVENVNPEPKDRRVEDFLTVYGNTKLAEIIISNKISEKLKKYGVKSNALHPGMISTNIWQGFDVKPLQFYELICKWVTLISVFFYARTPYEGAQGIIELAISDKHKETSGKFYWAYRMTTIFPDPWKLKNEKLCDAIWSKLETVVKLKPEEKLK